MAEQTENPAGQTENSSADGKDDSGFRKFARDHWLLCFLGWQLVCWIAIVPAAYFCSHHSGAIFPDHSRYFFVSDYSHVLTQETEEYIVSKASELEQRTKAQVVVVTVPRTGNQTLENYSLELANRWGIGDGELNNGILLLLVTKTGKARLEVGMGLEGMITDASAGRILDEYAVKAKSKSEWNRAAVNTFNGILWYLWHGYLGEQKPVMEDTPQGRMVIMPRGSGLSNLKFLSDEPGPDVPRADTMADMQYLPGEATLWQTFRSSSFDRDFILAFSCFSFTLALFSFVIIYTKVIVPRDDVEENEDGETVRRRRRSFSSRKFSGHPSHHGSSGSSGFRSRSGGGGRFRGGGASR